MSNLYVLRDPKTLLYVAGYSINEELHRGDILSLTGHPNFVLKLNADSILALQDVLQKHFQSPFDFRVFPASTLPIIRGAA